MTVLKTSTLEVTEPSNPTIPLVLHTRVVTGQGGGPEKTILNSPRFLEKLGYRSICAYMRSPQDQEFENIRARAQDANAPLIEVDDRGPLDFHIFKTYLEICRRENVAIWHSHDYKSNLIGLWVRRYWSMKLVTTAHGWVENTWRTPVYYAIDRWCQRRYDRVICVSDDLHQACIRHGIREDRCIFIPNAIDTSEFRRRTIKREAKRSLGFSESCTVIGAVGRLSPEKGFDVLISAFAEIAKSRPNCMLVIAGEGSDRSRLESLAVKLGVFEKVRFLGYRRDTKELYEAFDVFVLSSYREGLPNVLLEAMSLETPVVATRIAGVPKVVAHEDNGLLVNPGEPSQMAISINRLLESSQLQETLARAARTTIEARFSFHRRMERVASVYDSLMGASS